MHRTGILLLSAVLAAGPVAASEETDVMAVVHQWIDGFNKGDAKAADAACAHHGAIIDILPPHVWHGSGMCAQWWKDFNAYIAQNGITEPHAAPGKARHVDIDGTQAYLILPVTLTYKDHGKPTKETGSYAIMTFAKGNSGWRMTSWAWASGVTAAVNAKSGH